MDDVPSRPTERSRPENDDAPRGIYDVATEFAVMYREIARGAQDYLGKRCAREDFLDVTQIVADEAWKKALADPGCFARGELRKWATRPARWRYKDLLAERTGPFARSGFCGRNWMAMARTCAASDVGSFR
jgi:hypothetical protein